MKPRERLCLLAVHAHPDDEASKGAGTIARYSAEGVRTVLVTCTGGEAGDILNPEADTAEARRDLARARLAELRESAAALGYSRVCLLGYRDSGMPESEHNRHPDAFVNAVPAEATERLARIIRAERPQVIVAYGEDHSRYPHPDHIRAHEIAVAAFERAGEAAGPPGGAPGGGEPWKPSKLYYVGWSGEMIEALHAAFERAGLESPYREWIRRRPVEPRRFTTRIDVGEFLARRRAALLSHRTQIRPDSFWLRLPDEALREAWPYEEFVLARSRARDAEAGGGWETDLFAGLRAPVSRGAR